MEIGIVKWFNNAKGFGFITSESHDGDIFAHYSVIQNDGFRTLKTGQQVQFEWQASERGVSATKIILSE